MLKRSLMETNPYLQDRIAYKRMLFVNVSSSTTIELGSRPAWLVKVLKKEPSSASNGSKASA